MKKPLNLHLLSKRHQFVRSYPELCESISKLIYINPYIYIYYLLINHGLM